VSVGIVIYEGADADPAGRWFCRTTDARTDPKVTEAVVLFIDQQGARSVVSVNRIIGCPHEKASITRKAKTARYVRSGAIVTGGLVNHPLKARD